ncbi:hypothetical protein L6R29_23530 [Myxococcota bacterium]|nr:hypothetical protein [Myxococcota bacterium]
MRKTLRFLRAFALAFLGGLLLSQTAHATTDCGIPGYTQIPCHPDYPPQRKSIGNGIEEVFFFIQGVASVRYRGVPKHIYANQPIPLKAAIDALRQGLMQAWKKTPSERWLPTSETNTFQMQFGPNLSAFVAEVQNGYLFVVAEIYDYQHPLVKKLAQERYLPPQTKTDRSTILPMYPTSASPSPQTNQQGRQWLCNSVGYYRICTGSYGYNRRCVRYQATGSALHSDLTSARILSNGNCGSNMTQRIIIGNINGSGQRVSGCQVVSCR